MDLKPGTFIVLEGLDKTGKSTQRQALEGLFPDAYYTHQPSGGNVVGQVVYQLTEEVRDLHPVARQFLHLASHAEHYQREILPALSDRAVIMDRCWWSTMAYGWYAGGLQYLVDYTSFLTMAQLPTQGRMPDLVFLFLNPWEEDHHNTAKGREGYISLLEEYPGTTVVVPEGTVEEATEFIVQTLRDHRMVVG